MRTYPIVGELRNAKEFFGPDYTITSSYYDDTLTFAKGYVTEDVPDCGRLAHVKTVTLSRRDGTEYRDEQLVTIGADLLLVLGDALFPASPEKDELRLAAASYDPYRHDEDSLGFDNSYTGPSELELGGGCPRCGCPDDCLCDG